VSTISNKDITRQQSGQRAPRPINKGYGEAGASWHKKATKGFNAMSGSPRDDIDANNRTLRQRARMLYMAAPIATSAIKTNRTNVVGVGLQLKSRVDREILGMDQDVADAWQAKTEREFALWAKRKRACDATGVNDFAAMQQLALASWLVSGDVFAVVKQYDPTPLMPYSLRIHLIEADRIATPASGGIFSPMLATTGKAANGNTIYDGVEVNADGMIEAYHIRSNYPLELGAASTKWTRVQAYGDRTGLPNILHIMDSERPDQYRGVSYLAQVIEPLLQLRRYTESELTAAVVESFFTAFIRTETNPSENPFNEVGSSLPDVSDDPNEYEMGPGQINIMQPGEDVTFADPKRPSSGFDAFVRSISEQIGAALEIPADLLLKAFDASYSASRAALLEAWKAFKMRREWFVTDFCVPIYEIWMAEAVARGRINAPGFFVDPALRAAYLGAEWIGPSQGQLDPVKEITAEILAVGEGFSTREQSTIRLNGGQWDANVDQLARENAKLSEANAALKDSTSEPVMTASLRAEIIKAIKEGDTHESK
jgi:lambda family phage portal protein